MAQHSFASYLFLSIVLVDDAFTELWPFNIQPNLFATHKDIINGPNRVTLSIYQLQHTNPFNVFLFGTQLLSKGCVLGDHKLFKYSSTYPDNIPRKNVPSPPESHRSKRRKMLKTCIFAVMFSALAHAGFDYSITNPVKGTSWQFGSKATVKWLAPTTGGGPSPDKVDVVLMFGVEPNSKDVTTLASGVSPTALEVNFDTPNVEDGDKYFIKIGSPTLKDFKYSHFFDIKGGKPSANGLNSNSSSSATPSGSSNSSSSASSSSSSSSTSKSTGDTSDGAVMMISTFSALSGGLLAMYYATV
jgi:hypothetical protein